MNLIYPPLPQLLTNGKNVSDENVVRFDDLNLDVQTLIFEYLSFPDLINAAQISVHFSQVAVGVYRRQFAQYIVKIQADWLVDKPSTISENRTTIRSNFNRDTKILEIFGAHIRILKIDFNKISKERARHITTAINRNYFNSLVQLEITDCPDHFWRRMQNPFLNVESLTFRNKLNTIKRLRLNQVFPAVHQLALINVECDHSKCFNYQFPELKELYIRSTDVDKLLARNPQIESVSVNSATHFILWQINNHLPNLKKLFIDWLASNNPRGNNDCIRFGNVKQVRIRSRPNQIPTTVTFPQLEEFELKCKSSLSNNWIEYIVANGRHLTKLSILDMVMNEQLVILGEKFTQLTEANIKGGADVNCETLVNFVKANHGLRRMSFQTTDADFGSKINNSLHDEWHVEYSTDDFGPGMLLTTTLERK